MSARKISIVTIIPMFVLIFYMTIIVIATDIKSLPIYQEIWQKVEVEGLGCRVSSRAPRVPFLLLGFSRLYSSFSGVRHQDSDRGVWELGPRSVEIFSLRLALGELQLWVALAVG